MANIKQLEKSVRVLSSKLQKMGYECNVSAVKTGRYFDLGPSYVDLGVRLGNDFYGTYKFLANGYGGVRRTEFGHDSIRRMKEMFWEEFNKDITKTW